VNFRDNRGKESPIGRSVCVLGMHRSGTSAVTRVINLLGPSLCREKDIYTAPDNPTGHWESMSLVAVNDRLLSLFGGTFIAPAVMPDHWESCALVSNLYDQAYKVFRSAYPATAWIWKDPRTCLTLPFWRHVLKESIVAVFVHREPLKIAKSLQRRDGLGKAHCIALWERYVRSGLHGAVGMPLVTVSFDEMIAEPAVTVAELRAHLSDLGVSVPGDVGRAAQFVAAGQAASRHLDGGLADDADTTDAQRDLLTVVASLPRASACLEALDLGVESASTTELLSAIRGRDDYRPRFRAAVGQLVPAFHRSARSRLRRAR
jgi:hypothetical protein